MNARLLSAYPYVLAGAACLGLAAANAARSRSALVVVLAAGAVAAVALAEDPRVRIALVALALLLAGWWWGSARLDALDSGVLASHVGERASARIVVTGPTRSSGFDLRVPARVL